MHAIPAPLMLGAAFCLSYGLTRFDQAGVWDRIGRRLKRAVVELVR